MYIEIIEPEKAEQRKSELEEIYINGIFYKETAQMRNPTFIIKVDDFKADERATRPKKKKKGRSKLYAK